MISVIIGTRGEIALPDEVRQRYGMEAETPLRVIETRNGVLLVPLTDAPMSPELQGELAEWQSLGSRSWGMFEFRDEDR